MTSVVHGAFSNRLIDPHIPDVVGEIVDAIQSYSPDQLITPLDQLALERCARTLVQVRRIEAHLDLTSGGALITDDGKPVKSAAVYNQLTNQLMRFLGELGLTPASRARIYQLLSEGQKDAKVSESLAARLARGQLERRN